MSKTYIIIGTSAAGIGAAYRLRMLDATARIICISDEAETPYNKCFIVEYLSGERELSQVLTLTPESAQQKNIECMLGIRVIAIDALEKKVDLADGNSLVYDGLFIGTGCSPVIPAIEGIAEVKGVFTFYNLHDVNAMHTFIRVKSPRVAIVMGAGLTGLEAADGLIAQGLNVHVIERAAHVLPNQITQKSAEVIHDYMRAHQITLHLESSVVRIVHNDGAFSGVVLQDGTILEADMLICAVGVRPNGQLAQQIGARMHNGYISVDDYMQTSLPDVYAGGDVVLVKNQITGELGASCTWPDAMQQGMTAAYAMSGQLKKYPGIIPVTSSSFFGIKFAVCGNVKHIQPHQHIEIKQGEGWYHLFVYDQDCLKGFVLIGNTTDFSQLRRQLLLSHQ